MPGRVAGALLLAALVGTGVGCRAAAGAFGGSPAVARDNGAAFFGAVADRFTRVRRAPKFEAARIRLGRYAASPSKIWGDTGVWTSSTADGSRQLVVAAGLQDGHYWFLPRPDAPLPRRVGDSRHTIRLHRIDDGEYEWFTGVEQAVGDARAADVAAVFSALLDVPAARGERELRADYRATFPRAAAALGRLFTLDTLRAQHLADGSSLVTVAASLHPERLRATMPAFADYVVKYIKPARYHIVLADRQGGRWLDMVAENQMLTIRTRSKEGRLLPLEGPARPLPDRLQLQMDAFAKVLIFTVGATGMNADFAFVETAHERGWAMRFDQEPEWHLPLATRHLISASLRRPFERGGTLLRITVRDSAGASSLLTRTLRTAVKESAIVRWMGSLGFTAMNDFTGPSEEEENRFLSEAFGALRDDVRALPIASLAPERAGP